MTQENPPREGEDLKQTILNEYPRLTPESRFKFRCHSGIDCFNRCCGDVNIVLTPYDVLRLRHHLGLGSQEFLAQHTVRPFTKDQKLPVVLLKMQDNERKSCPFVTPEGCSVYDHRPWSCRMYPVGLASSQTRDRAGEEFFFILEEDHCHGHREDQEWSIAEWMENQGVAPYNAFGELFKEVTLHERLVHGEPLDPRQMEMYFMACYELDRFRRFVFESRFLDCFELASTHVEQLRTDDEELLKFAFEWLRFSLFGEPVVKVNAAVLEAKRREMAQQQDKQQDK